MKITEIDLQNAYIIRDYMLMKHNIQKSDAILGLGSHDITVAQKAAELFLDWFAPLLVFSWGSWKITDEWIFKKSEAETFADIAIKMWVSSQAILLDTKSTNTGENIKFSYEILKNHTIKNIILVHKPYMERRTLATFEKQRGDKNTHFFVTSPNLTFETYFEQQPDKKRFISLMVWDLQRIKIYPEQWFQSYQAIPELVWEAYKKLVEAWYTEFIMK